MAHWKKSFPSKYLQAADLDAPVVATVKEIVNENIGQGENVELKPVVHWHEAVKPVVLNQTRAEMLAELAKNEDTDNWPGTRVLLRKGSTSYKGKRVACIEFAAPPPVQRPPARVPPKPAPAPPAVPIGGPAFEEPSDEEEPF